MAYVLAHVLEAVLPGHDLGDSPSCELSLGPTLLRCPIPSTLQSENVVLPIRGEADPVVQVRAFDSQQRAVGLVVVPVSTLVPLEVWNVWYAMDDGGEDGEERPPEETPKMHLLLQYVSEETAAEEAAQLREMRAQDFLLRALQQLNASLEAKVMVRQRSAGPGFAGPRPGPPVAAWEPASVGGAPYLAGQSASAFGAGLPDPPPPRPGASLGSLSQAVPSLPSTTPSSPLDAPRRGVPPELFGRGPAAAAAAAVPQALAQAHWEEALLAHAEPYERMITALQEKLRACEGQEAQLQAMSQSLADAEARCSALQAQLQGASAKARAEVEAEQESARQAHAAQASAEQQIVELRQELALRQAHEDSLQKRILLMESELSVINQKCGIVEHIEKEAAALRKEVENQKELRRALQEEVDERGRAVARLSEEVWQQREEHSKELHKARCLAMEEQKAAESLRQELKRGQDVVRDKEVEQQLLAERLEEMKRQRSALEGEATRRAPSRSAPWSCRPSAQAASYQAMLERERQQRREVEHRLDEQELQRLSALLDEHRRVIRELREETLELRREVQEERARNGVLETEHAAAQKELVKARQAAEEIRQTSRTQEEFREELQAAAGREHELRVRAQALQEEMRLSAERHERELQERAQSERRLSEERDERQREVGSLRVELSRAQQRAEELRLLQEQTSRSLLLAREEADRAQELHAELLKAQEERRNQHASRDGLQAELQRLSGKAQEDARSANVRVQELEAMMEERNNEIKLLMYRVQELSSRYSPVRGDSIDMMLAKWINGYRPAVPFFRLGPGLYLFGRRQVICKIANEKPVFRVGGGFIGFDKFLELYASEELERLLSYELDERTGEPKFVEALRVRQLLEDCGAIDDLRERAERGQPSRDGGTRPLGGGVDLRDLLRDRAGFPGGLPAASDRRRSPPPLAAN